MSSFYGLDYGTTTSQLFSYDNGVFKEIYKGRSAVKVFNKKEVKTGADALNDVDANGFLVESPKRAIDNLGNVINGVTYKEMMAAILLKMVKEVNIGHDSHITLTVPNSYDDIKSFSMYQILDDCLNERANNRTNHNIEIHILPEPVAAALFYVYRHIKELPNTSHLVVCDIGGGTTDLCIVECKKETGKLRFSVIKDSMQHSDEIGGNKFDDEIQKRINFPLEVSPMGKKNMCQDLKCELSEKEEHSILKGTIWLTRSEFEIYIDKYLHKLKTLMEEMLEQTRLSADDTWYILPVGGSCQIPAIRRTLEEVFVGARQTAEEEHTIFDSVAQGATVYSAWCAGALSIDGYNEISIENRTQHEYQIYNFYREWQTLFPANLTNGIYPKDNTDNITLLAGNENVKINKKEGNYTIGDIKIKEKKENAKPLECKHDKAFRLEGRSIDKIKVQLGVEIKDCHIVRWWLKDCLTNEIQEWTLKASLNP